MSLPTLPSHTVAVSHHDARRHPSPLPTSIDCRSRRCPSIAPLSIALPPFISRCWRRRQETQRRWTIDGDDVYRRQETAAAAEADDKLEGPRPSTRDYCNETQQRETAEIANQHLNMKRMLNQISMLEWMWRKCSEE